ncbi:MAG: hypothetical protein WD226_13945 [Planctomycetota bacterium]
MFVPFLLAAALAPDVVLELPAGSAEVAWERAQDAQPARPDVAPWASWPAGWDAPEPWRRWELLVLAAPSDEQAFALANLAAAQGRGADAWTHFAAIEAGAVVAALERELFQDLDPGPVLHLAPPLPPPGDEARPFIGRKYARTWTSGATRLRLEVAIEPDGTEVGLTHLAGPPLDVRVVLPVPPAVRVAVTYADWARQDDVLAPLVFELSAEDPEHTGWGRFLPAPRDWPRAMPRELPAGVRAGGIEVVWRDAPLRARHEARSFGRLLDVPARHVSTPVIAGPTPLRIHLAAHTSQKEIDLFGLVERWALTSLPRTR